jgi:hypothetical protein
MTRAKIAKNLLEGKNCGTCQNNINGKCMLLQYSPIPEDFTCVKWKKIEDISIHLTSTPITIQARKLNVTWTTESVLDMASTLSDDVTTELDAHYKKMIDEIVEKTLKDKSAP